MLPTLGVFIFILIIFYIGKQLYNNYQKKEKLQKQVKILQDAVNRNKLHDNGID